ncbi:MAG TPA: hypothetical protein VIZ86_09230, partial [Pseudomonas sp.]
MTAPILRSRAGFGKLCSDSRQRFAKFCTLPVFVWNFAGYTPVLSLWFGLLKPFAERQVAIHGGEFLGVLELAAAVRLAH